MNALAWPYNRYSGDGYRLHPKEHRMWELRRISPRGWRQDRSRRLSLSPVPRRHPLPPASAPTPSLAQSLKSLDEATVFLINHFEKNKDEIARLINALRRQDERAEFDFIRCINYWFQQMGKIIFAGLVTPLNTSLKEQPFGRDGHGRRDRPGRTYIAGLKGPLVEIHLHTTLLQAKSARGEIDLGTQTISFLLHQMIHAYFIIACGHQADGKEPDGRLKHKEHFCCILYKIRELSGSNGTPLPLDSGHNIRIQPFRSGHVTRDRMADTGKYNDYTCSDCTAMTEGVKVDKINEWYKNKCVKAVDPDIFEYKDTGKPVPTPLSKCGDAKEWVEVTYRKKPYKIDRSRIEKHPSLRKVFEGGNRKLKIQDDVEEEVFACLMRFLASGTYGHSLAATINRTKGPPIIRDVKEQWPPFIMTEIKLHQLCSALGFIELRRIATKRLNDQNVCHEDPADILKAIYRLEKDPEKDLRTWARAFMKHYIPSHGRHPIETSNWKKLSEDEDLQDQMDYRRGMCHFLLRIDFDEVGEELRELQCAPFPLLPPPPTNPCTHTQPQLTGHPYYQPSPHRQY